MSVAEVEASTVFAAASIPGVIAIPDSGSESESGKPIPSEDCGHSLWFLFFCLGSLIFREVQ